MIGTSMVLAAGFGTRMRHLTQHRPKPLIEVAGRPMIDRALDHLVAAGIPRAVVNLHHFGDQIRHHLARRDDPEIAFSVEAPEVLETGGGILQALPLLGRGAFGVMNSDAIWTGCSPFLPLARAWDPERMDALLLCVPKERAHGYTRPGDFSIEEGGLIRRRGDAATAPFVYTGAQIIKAEAFDGLAPGRFSLNLVWNRLIETHRGLHGLVYPGGWCDVGTPEGIEQAEAALRVAEH